MTAVTANEAGSKACYLDGRYGSTPSPLWVSCSCRIGKALVSNPRRDGPARAMFRRIIPLSNPCKPPSFFLKNVPRVCPSPAFLLLAGLSFGGLRGLVSPVEPNAALRVSG